MNAFIQTTKDGYIVMWKQDSVAVPLRCFGDYRSAAMEFRDYLNNEEWKRKEQQIRIWAASYNPAVKYSYPEYSAKSGIALKRQKL